MVDNDSDTNDRPIFDTFNPVEEMTKNFKFTVSMEFSSLKQFKEAILEHNVLNDREVKFRKNDANRCRVICKFFKSCNYKILVSRVGWTTTFRVKTLCLKHICERQHLT